MALHLVTQVKQIEKKDAVLTGKQQIDRLLKPGASYMNLNPFEVTTPPTTPPTSPCMHAKFVRKMCRPKNVQ